MATVPELVLDAVECVPLELEAPLLEWLPVLDVARPVEAEEELLAEVGCPVLPVLPELELALFAG